MAIPSATSWSPATATAASSSSPEKATARSMAPPSTASPVTPSRSPSPTSQAMAVPTPSRPITATRPLPSSRASVRKSSQKTPRAQACAVPRAAVTSPSIPQAHGTRTSGRSMVRPAISSASHRNPRAMLPTAGCATMSTRPIGPSSPDSTATASAAVSRIPSRFPPADATPSSSSGTIPMRANTDSA